ncbi:MAG: FAD-dependent oxidoreductase [Steroidobacteraceae bacterium]|jgi:glycerol-3-phosphate dehydrogenase|nr:FAD-dependent oxidoreductase [Steroidobacteraceae bacterium]
MRRDVAALESLTFDVAVVGGGIHGAWIALRAARAGLCVVLLERGDFGAGTSANSLRIVHGGLRYLQHLDLARMRRSIAARRAFCRESPHLVAPLPCLLPLQGAGVRSPWLLGPALVANDVVAWDRNRGVAIAARLPRGRLLGAAECRRRLAPLVDLRASAGALWWDAIALDPARLALEPVLAAAELGAAVANRLEARALLLAGGRVHGVVAVDRVARRDVEIRADVVVDATGPGGGRLATLAGLAAPYRPPRWVGALNLVLGRRLALEGGVALGAASRRADGSAWVKRATRELFFVPHGATTLVGTDYLTCDDDADPAAPPHDLIARFLDEAAGVAPRAELTAKDVVATHWGLLPAEDVAPDVPRKSPTLVAGADAAGAAGLVVAIGEKLTSAPDLSARVLACVRRELGTRRGATVARLAPAPHGRTQPHEWIPPSCDAAVEARLRRRYGTRWLQVAAHADGPEGLQAIAPGTDVRGVEILHALREEMALGLDDLVLRRLGLGDAGHPGAAVLDACAAAAARELGWSEPARRAAVAALDQAFEVSRTGLGASSPSRTYHASVRASPVATSMRGA